MSALLHGPLPLFIAQALAIIATSRIFGFVARRIGQPTVIAEIGAGIALGPSLLGWLAPEFSAQLFPASSLGNLGLLSQIGLLLFMFLVGLEFDPALLRGRGRNSIIISLVGILVPFGLGALLALHLYPRVSSPSVPWTWFMLFMGVAMSITAFPVLARILTERRLLNTKIGAIAIICAAFGDVAAWCILAFILAVVHASGLASALWTTLFTFAYVTVMLALVRPLARRIGARSLTKEGLSQNVVAGILALVLLSAWLTDLIGIHALFGAFIIGAVIPKDNRFGAILADKIEDVVVVLLLPLFFAYSGLRTQIGLLNSPGAWLDCAVIIAIACLGKFGGTTAAARLTGLKWSEASAIGTLMNTRGLMELVVLNIGLDLGVISPELFTMMVIMALVTTFMTTPVLSLVYPPSRLSEKLVEEARPSTPPPKETFVGLLCVAYPATGRAMATLGAALIGRTAGSGRIYALRLVPPADRASFVLDQQGEVPVAAGLGPLLERAQALSLEVTPLSFVSTQPSRDICSVAEVKRASLIVLGWHRPIIGNAMLTGTVSEVMQAAATDVGVLIDRGLDRIERVLVPYLGSTHDRAALILAKRIATNAGARVTILHVVRPKRDRIVEAEVREVFSEPESGVEVTFLTVDHKDPSAAALEESKRGYDLVLIGATPEWGLEPRQFGVQSELLIARSPASLLIVRQRPDRR